MFAQAATDTDTATHRTRSAVVHKDKDVKVEKADKADKTATGETFGEKTKHAFHAMGEKIRNAGHRMSASTKKDKASDDTRHASTKDDKRNDTRSMGASRDTTK